MGELLPVANKDENGLMSKNNSVITSSAGNKCSKLSYKHKGSLRSTLIGMYEMNGKAYFCCIQFSFSLYGKNISIISSNILNDKIVKYIHTDSTLDIYIEMVI